LKLFLFPFKTEISAKPFIVSNHITMVLFVISFA
jgi:hypothetical protein